MEIQLLEPLSMFQLPIGSNTQTGISILEIMLMVTIIVVALSALFGLIFFVLISESIAKQTMEAFAIAQETGEAVRNFRDGIAWNADDVNNEYDGLGVIAKEVALHAEQSSDSPPRWKMISGSQTINGFTRQVVFDDVSRDANDDIASSGTNDPDTKKATITVSWQERERAHQIQVVTYFTNWKP